MLALVRCSISSARLIATAAMWAIARASSVSSPLNLRRGGDPAHSSPSRSPPAVSGVSSRSPMSRSGHRLRAAGPEPPPSSASIRNPAAEAVGGVETAAGSESQQLQAVVGVQAIDLAELRLEQPPRARRHDQPEVLRAARRRHFPAQRRQARERVDAAALALVELGVLDRARDERGDVHEQLQRVLGELARGLGVEHDHAERVARARQDRDRDHRLEALLLQQRDVLHARVVHRALADELGRAMAGHPSGEALLDRELHAPDGVGEHLRCGADRQLVVFEQVDEAGVAVRRLGRQIDDPLQHRAELDRRRHELDDAIEGAVLLAEPAGLGDSGHMCAVNMLPTAIRAWQPLPRSGPGRYTYSR